MTVYSNNSVEITSEVVDVHEVKINVNGANLMWISAEDAEKFKEELTDLLNKYRI